MFIFSSIPDVCIPGIKIVIKFAAFEQGYDVICSF